MQRIFYNYKKKSHLRFIIFLNLLTLISCQTSHIESEQAKQTFEQGMQLYNQWLSSRYKQLDQFQKAVKKIESVANIYQPAQETLTYIYRQYPNQFRELFNDNFSLLSKPNLHHTTTTKEINSISHNEQLLKSSTIRAYCDFPNAELLLYHPYSEVELETITNQAKNGVALAQFALACALMLQQNNNQEAYVWLDRAALQGFQPALNMAEQIKGGLTTKFSVLYPFEEGEESIEIMQKIKPEFFDDYCKKIYQPFKFDDFEDYIHVYPYVEDLYTWVNTRLKKLIATNDRMDYNFDNHCYVIEMGKTLCNMYAYLLNNENLFNHQHKKQLADYQLQKNQNTLNQEEIEIYDSLVARRKCKHYLASMYRKTLVEIASCQLRIIAFSQLAEKQKIKHYAIFFKETKQKLKEDYFGFKRSDFEIDYINLLDNLYEVTKFIVRDLPMRLGDYSKEMLNQPPNRLSARLKEKKELTKRKKIINLTKSNNFPQETVYMVNLITQNDQLTKLIFADESCTKVDQKQETLEKQFIDLEQTIFRQVPNLANNSNIDFNKLTKDSLIAYYKELAILGNFLPIISLMNNGILVHILSNKIPVAKMRVEVMKAFCADQTIPKVIPADYKINLAYAAAACGDFEDLTYIYRNLIQKKLTKEKKKKLQHQQILEQIKAEKKEPTKEVVNASKKSTLVKRVKLPNNQNDSIPSQTIAQPMHSFHGESLKKKSEKVKRHQEALNRRQRNRQASIRDTLSTSKNFANRQDFNVEQKENYPNKECKNPCPNNLLEKENNYQVHQDIQFKLPRKAYQTVQKIFNDNWKIKRQDIENLFVALGHEMNCKTKSSHHVILIPNGLILIDQHGTIQGIISNLSAIAGGNLSLPNWKTILPIYMRKQIQHLLACIGICKNNVSQEHAMEGNLILPLQKKQADWNSTREAI